MKPFACAAIAAMGLVAVSPAQEQKLGPGDKPCGICHSTGKIPFELPKPVVAQEQGAVWCSEVVADALLNHGIDWKVCADCQAPTIKATAQKAYDVEVAKRMEWLKSRREIDKFLDDPKLKLMHVSTAHFELAWSIPKVKIGRVVYEQHDAMHLYANRLEEAYQSWLDTFGFKHETDENGVRPVIMCFESAVHATQAQPKYTGMGGTGATEGTKLMGGKSVFVCWWNKVKNKDDAEFHEYLMHNVDHLFLTSYYNYFWLARKNGWIDEGLSHYFTDKKFGSCRTHCYQEQDEAAQWILTPWRPELKKRVAANKIPVFAEVIVKHGESLNAEEHLFVFSWVQYLLDAFGKDKFVQLVRGLKEQVPLRNILQDVYGVSPFQFIENWKKYVISTYPSR